MATSSSGARHRSRRAGSGHRENSTDGDFFIRGLALVAPCRLWSPRKSTDGDFSPASGSGHREMSTDGDFFDTGPYARLAA